MVKIFVFKFFLAFKRNDSFSEKEELKLHLTSWSPDCTVINKTVCGKLRVTQTRNCQYFAQNLNTGNCDWINVTSQENDTNICNDAKLERQIICRHGNHGKRNLNHYNQ